MNRLLVLPAAVAVAAAIVTSAAGGRQSNAATARFAVTITAEVDTSLEYFLTGRRDDGCEYLQLGRTLRMSEVASTAPTIVHVRGGRRAAYSPSELRSLRLRRRDYAGDVVTTFSCSDGRTFSESRECEPVGAVTTEAIPQLAFRRTQTRRISWSPLPQPPMVPCGLEQDTVEAGWLQLATGRVDERALLASRRRIVRVRAQRNIADVVIVRPAATRIRRTIGVRWTLTFRRLG